MRIAVVDDEETLHQTLEQYFLQFQIAADCDLTVGYYYSCEEIYRQLTAGKEYDLLLLDVEFPQMCGDELGRMIRHRLLDDRTQIVYISAIRDYASELFPVRPADFLVKPIGYERFAKMLEAALKENKRSSTFLEYTLENTRHRIRTSEVLFLKAYGKKVAFHTRDGSFTVYGKIRDLIAGCEDQFLCISRGEYANIRHVLSAAPREVRLTDNHILHISRGRAGAVSQRLAEL